MSHMSWNDLFELIDEPVGSSRRQELEQHLSTCPRCRQLLESQRYLERVVRTVPSAEPSAGFTDRVVGQLHSSRKERSSLRLLTFLGAGIPLVLVGVLIGYALSLGQASPASEGDEIFGGAFGDLSGVLDRAQSALSSMLGDTGTAIAHYVQSDTINIAALALVSFVLLFIADRLLLRRILRSRV